MGGVPTKHHSHGKTARRRSHMALKKQRLFICPQCKAPKLANTACANCGYRPARRKASTAKPE